MRYVYLDWNIFNKIESKDSLNDINGVVYERLEKLISLEDAVVPYSNAHLNDLIRGYRKNPAYVDGHLNIIEKITRNLCICQYWNHPKVTWHYRPVREFFETALEEAEFSTETLEEFIEDEDFALLRGMYALYKHIPVPKEFKLAFQADPIFNIIYPRTRVEMTQYAMIADLYNFSILINKDFSLYKNLKKFIVQSINKLRQSGQLVQMVKTTTNNPAPKYFLNLVSHYAFRVSRSKPMSST